MTAVMREPVPTVFLDDLAEKVPASSFRVLVPVANPSTSGDLLDLAADLVRGRKGEIVALHVLVSDQPFPNEEEKRSAAARRTILEQVVTGRRRSTIPVHTVTRIANSPAQGILATTTESHYSLVLLGWEGRIHPVSLGSSLGEVLDLVIKNAPSDVAVVKNRGMRPLRRILVPTAGGPNALLALQLALTVAKRHRAAVTVLYVAKRGDEEAGRKMLERSVQEMKTRQTVQQRVVESDHVVKAILKEARDYDLVILGASREGIFRQILFGVVPEQVAKRCSKSVIMVKGQPGPLVKGLRRLWQTWMAHKAGLSVLGFKPK